MAAVFFAILIVEATILFFSVNNYERDSLAELEREAIVVMRSIIRSARARSDTMAQLPAIGKNLRANSVLSGAQIFDKTGTKIYEFGELPSLPEINFKTVSKIIRQEQEDSHHLDVLWPPSKIKEPYYVAARIDTSEIVEQITAFIWRIVSLVLLSSVFVTIVTMVVLGCMILTPIRILRNSLLIAGADPGHSDKYIIKISRIDELGDVINAFNQMLRQTGANFGQIKKQGEELEKHRDRLELLVSERTARLEIAKMAAESANAVKTEFLAHMSHELRTPLNAIIGFSRMWMDQVLGPIENKTYLEYAKNINDSGNHLLQIISGILDLTKIEDGKKEIDVTDIDLESTIDDCVSIFEQSSIQKGLRVCSYIAPDVSVLRADERLFKQILFNIIGNAIKFSSDDGQVDISACKKEDGSTTITISDKGAGIHPEDLKLILEPFGQVRRNAHVVHGGIGLGLPLAKRLTELHDGTLKIDSEPGAGTTVTVSFPPS